MKQLSNRQQQILEFIQNALRRSGVAPTLREIRDHLRIESIGSVGNMLDALVKKGFLKRGGVRGLLLANPESEESIEPADPFSYPLLGQIAAGVPITAIQHVERYISVDRSITKGREGFCLRVKGDSMKGAGILEGDILVVARQTSAQVGDIVVALLNEEATVKYFQPKRGEVFLVPANEKYTPRRVGKDDDFQIQGKVIGVFYVGEGHGILKN